MLVEVFTRGPAGKRGEGLRAHEPVCAGRDERDHLVTRLDEQPGHLTRLVSSDATGDPEQDPRHAKHCARSENRKL